MFEPWKDCRIVHVHRSTPVNLLTCLIDSARKTIMYTIDTEGDFYTHQPALIQIEFVGQDSLVILFEMCHMPLDTFDGHRCHLIRLLFETIFHTSNIIYAWGSITNELSNFVRYGFFSDELVHDLNLIDVQLEFKYWYNKTFTHQCSLLWLTDNDDPSCTCLHRPVKDNNHQWSLQKAIAYTFGEFLDKSRTLSHWSRPLLSRNSKRRSSLVTLTRGALVDDMIRYAVDDCLAVTKLAYVINVVNDDIRLVDSSK